MNRFITGLIISLIIILGLAPATALAQGPGADGMRVHFGNNVTLNDGDTVEGGVIVFGGNLTMLEGSEVEGDVVVFGGNVRINGEVEGNVATLGGNVRVLGKANIDGDVTSLGGNVSVSPEADVGGVVADGLEVEVGREGVTVPGIPDVPGTPKAPDVPASPEIEPPQPSEPPRPPTIDVPRANAETQTSFAVRVGQFIGHGIQDIFWAVIVAGLAVLLVLFFPANIHGIQDTLAQAAPVSFVVGVVTFLAAATVTVLLGIFFWLIIPICGIFLVVLALTIAWLGGWTVIGQYVGDKIFAGLGAPARSEISTTFLGVLSLSLVATMPFVGELPLIGWMFGFLGFLVVALAGSTGLGAVILSKFGTQIYQPPSSSPPPTPAPESEADEPTSEAMV